MEKREADLFEEVELINKLTHGYHLFGDFWDAAVLIDDDVWQVHAYFLGSRSKKILEEFDRTIEVHGRTFRRLSFTVLYRFEHKFLRWLYTDCVVFEDNDVALALLEASQFYELPTLFERCEQAIVANVDITSCAHFHSIAVKRNATTILNRCKYMISQYFNKAKSPDCFEMDVEDPHMEFDDPDNSVSNFVTALDLESSPHDGIFQFPIIEFRGPVCLECPTLSLLFKEKLSNFS